MCRREEKGWNRKKGTKERELLMMWMECIAV